MIDTATGATLAVLPDTRTDVRADFSPDSSRLVVPTSTQRGVGQATVFNATTGDRIFDLTTDDVAITWAVYSPDGSKIMTQGEVGVTRVWDAATGEQLTRLTDSDSGSTFSPDGTMVLSIGPSGRVRIRSSSTGEPMGFDQQLETSESEAAWSNFAGSAKFVIKQPDPADENLAIVTFWNSEDGSRIGDPVSVLAQTDIGGATFADQRDLWVTLADDGTVEAWQTSTAAIVARIVPFADQPRVGHHQP